MEIILFIVLVAVLFTVCILGALKTFRRDFLVAILMFCLLFPVWLIWAFVEIFTPPLEDE